MGNHNQTSRLVRQGSHIHLNLHELLEKVVAAVLWEVEGGQLLDTSTRQWNSRRWIFPAVKPIQVTATNVTAMAFQGDLGLLELVLILECGLRVF